MVIAGGQELESRITAAALACVARWGVAKTTLDDVAREAGCSRATIYRQFEGGKAAVLRAVLRAETERLRHLIDTAVAGRTTLDDTVVAGTVAVARFLRSHDALAYLLAHEPDLVLPHVAFGRLDWVFAVAARFAEPHIAPYLPPEELTRAAEWLARVVLSFTLSPAASVDLTDEADARRFLLTYLVPALTPSLRS